MRELRRSTAGAGARRRQTVKRPSSSASGRRGSEPVASGRPCEPRVRASRSAESKRTLPRVAASTPSRAPSSAAHRARPAIGQWASDTATQALASVLAPQPNHRGRPSDMIAALATGIGFEMGLPPEEIERIRIASLLHDLGKIAIPEEILDKPTTLSDDEWQAIGEHPRIGQVILEQASNLREAIPVVLHHHERFNGGGYPHGLRGNEIPIGARIVRSRCYHAMVHARPTRGRSPTRGARRASPSRRNPVRPGGWDVCNDTTTPFRRMALEVERLPSARAAAAPNRPALRGRLRTEP